MNKALVVEDEKALRELLSFHLQDLHLEVDTVEDGLEGLNLAKSGEYAVIILDLMLPSKDGIQICSELRGKGVTTPILMLTAKSEEFDKVLGLEVGADDYLTKPFSVREFIARVKALVRRSTSYSAPKSTVNVIKVEGLVIDLDKRQVKKNDQKIELTPKEFDLLYLLAEHPGKSYSREDLLQKIWGYDFKGYEHTVNSHVNRLRAKIEDDPNKPEFVKTVWGIGYAFKEG